MSYRKSSRSDDQAYSQLTSPAVDIGADEVRVDSAASINDVAPKQSCCDLVMQRLFNGDIKVALYALGLLVASTGNSIFFKKMTNHMVNYPYFLNQVSSFVYLPVFFSIVWWELRYTNYITPEMLKFPKRKYLVMGLFDSLSGIFMLFGGIHTSGSFQALLLNFVIPVTMGLSILILKTKYKWNQYSGATIILAGVATVIIPTIIDGSNDDNQIVFNLLFLISTIPQALSSIYKEIGFGEVDLDVNLLQAWVAFFQFWLGLLLIPVNALPFLGDSTVRFQDLPYALSNGARCLFGYNSRTNSTVQIMVNNTLVDAGSCWLDSDHKWGAPENAQCDDCEGAWLPVFLYIFFNCFYNLFIVLVIKYGSAALLWVTLTLRLPLVQIAFALSFINNPPDTFRATSIVGLFVILFGLILYRYSSVAGAIEQPAEVEATQHDALLDSETQTDSADADQENNKL